MKQFIYIFFLSLCWINRAWSTESGTVQCDETIKYRTIDGRCNNLQNPEWGMTNIPYQRLLPNAYQDGLSTPRTKLSDGTKLPSARALSIRVNDDIGSDGQSPVYTFMHMQFGQFLIHDVLSTKGNNEDCGTQNCGNNGECFPIITPDFEEDFTTQCIKFVRSFGQSVKGIREQINTLTAFFDAGVVYGNDQTKVNNLRDMSNTNRGRLITTPHPIPGLKDLLPKDNVEEECFNTNETIKCFIAGDARVNVQMGLTAVHTIFHRTHNMIEENLFALNNNWNGETLYQESRRIVIAGLQHIIYNEYIPLLLGPEAMEQFDLKLATGDEYWNGYDSNINPTVSNQFATAAFRHGHSMIGTFIRFANALGNVKHDRLLSTVMMRPLSLYVEENTGSGVDGVLRGMASIQADVVDRHISEQMTLHLFTPNAPLGVSSDIASRNIQRGRDHGLKSYIEWRRYCNLSADMSDIPAGDRDRLLSQYSSGNMNDVDLWPACLAEEHIENAMIGPTFACLIGVQLKKLRAGDRFWFENDDTSNPGAFTIEQLIEIRKFTLAYLICENGDDIGMIQPKVMLQPMSRVDQQYRDEHKTLIDLLYPNGESNERVDCSALPKPDFTKWNVPNQ